MKAFNRKKYKYSKEFTRFSKGGYAICLWYSKENCLAKYKRRGSGIGIPPKLERNNYPCNIKSVKGYDN